MRALLQRVLSACVEVDGVRVSRIDQGILVFLGVARGDDAACADWLVDKLCGLRIFPGTGVDGNVLKPMNESVVAVQAEVLVVSQFTLVAEVNKGRRPGFSSVADPVLAKSLYEYFCKGIEQRLGKVARGEFGADMQVQLVNDGPVTFVLDSPAIPS
ncbi:MAG: D-tyrosyl-tRNA(Tyr) deacylase [Pseudomonadales bacterium]|nr:D-tyrosyl-tRNA(Tyr) deacylase [Pseudomonadales bacterium]